jgi:hypothetical protein
VCNDCIGAGNYPEVIRTYEDVQRTDGDDGATFKGEGFSILPSGDAEFTVGGGTVQKGKVYPARPFGNSHYCQE